MKKYLWFITILLVVFLLSQCAAPAPVVKNSPPSKPANPNPANGANGIDITPTLSWTCSDPDGDTLTFDIYFGTNSNPPLLKSNHTSTNYQTNALNYNTTYYWKIVAKDNKGASTVGDVWSFTTGAAPNNSPNKPTNPNPQNGTTNVGITPTLSWTCSDPDGDALKYDIYFGTTSSPQLAKGNQTETTYNTEALNYSTTYYWKIVAKDGKGGYTEGDVWSFTTISAPNNPPEKPSNPDPQNEATGVSITPTLSWNCSDPDSDTLTFDIYFGTNSNPPLLKSNHTSTNYQTNALNYNTTYYWKIVAKDNKGASTVGDVWSFTTGAAPNNSPNKPTNPNPQNGTTNVGITPTLSWTCSDPDGDALKYDIYFGTTSSPQLAKGNQTETTYNTEALNYSTTYYWKIVAKDGKGGYTEGDVWSFTTISAPNNPPEKPSNPDPQNGATGVSITPTLSWNCSDPDSDTLTFDIYFGTNSNPPLLKSNHTSTNYQTNALNYNTTYYWKIVAKDNKGASTVGDVWSFTTGAAPNNSPNKPTNPNPQNGTTNVGITPTLSWTCSDPDGDALKYDIYFGTTSSPQLAKGNQTETTYNTEALNYSTTYYWKIVAKDGKGGYTEGDVWSFTTISAPNNPPEKPSNPDPQNEATGVSITPTLSWNCSDPDSDTLTFDIYFGTNSNPPLLKSNHTSTNYQTNTLNYNTTYYWKIVAKDNKGASTVGDVWSFTTGAAPNNSPNKPTNPNPQNGATGVSITPTLSWSCSDPDSDALKYDIYFGTDSNPSLAQSDCVLTMYDPRFLSYETTYYWKIVAKDGKGGYTEGDVWSFTTEMMPGLRILKKIKLDGPVYSSPAVGTDGNIYIGSQVGYFVIDPQNYEIVENVSTEPIWCSPIVDETTGKVYFASSDGKIHIYPDKSSYEISDSSIYPRLYSAPVLYEDYLYIIDTEGELIRVNKSDLSDKTIVLETDFSVRSSAVIHDGNMYFASQYGSVVKVSLSTYDSERLIFDVDSFQGGFAIALDGTLFVSGTTIWALDPNSVQIPKWYYTLDSQTYANPVLSEDDIIYVGDALGTLYAFEAKGGLCWKKMNLGSIYSSCVIGDNKIIYVAAGDQLLAIDPQNHDVIDSVELEGHVESNPVLYDGKLFVADTEGYLYIISALSDAIQDPDLSWPMYQKDLYHSGKR